MSLDVKKTLEKIIDELESLKGENEILAIALSYILSELPLDSASKFRSNFTKAVSETNNMKPAASPKRRKSRGDAYSKVLSALNEPE